MLQRRDGRQEACDCDRDATANDARKTAISSSDKCSEYVSLEKQRGLKKEGV